MTTKTIQEAVQQGLDSFIMIANTGDVDATNQAAGLLEELRTESLMADEKLANNTLTKQDIEKLRSMAGDIEVLMLTM